jgi:hypothetical protein
MFAKRAGLRKIACGLSGLGFAGWLAWSGGQVLSQEPVAAPAAPKSYLNKTTINLPIVMDERSRAQVQSIQLWMKDGAAHPWRLWDKAPPSQTTFSFKAPREGEYWFNLVSVDQAGRSTPADVTKEAPGLIVVLDTQPPQVDVQALQSSPEGQWVRCEARDANLDNYKTKFFYQTGDHVWRLLDSVSGKSDIFCIPVQAAWNGNVRAVAVDLAGNTTTREMNLGAMAAYAPAAGSSSPTSAVPTLLANLPPSNAALATSLPAPAAVQQAQAPPMPTPTRARTPETSDNVLPLVPALTPAGPAAPPLPSAPSAPRTSPEKTGTLDVVVQKVAPPAPQLFDPAFAAKTPHPNPDNDVKTAALAAKELPIQRQFVNSPRVYLDYRIEALGASGVGKVEVWTTRDLCQSWQKLCEIADRKSPAELNLPGEGVYGVIMVVSNGRGFGAVPPNPGDAPDTWIEVDTTKPVAELVHVRAGVGDDSAALNIAWNARDKNLSNEAVELYFASRREGPWQPIAKGLKNDGIYRWVPPADAGPHAFIRLTARDLANNVSSTETPQPVALDDLSRPRGRVVGVATTPPRSTVPVAP